MDYHITSFDEDGVTFVRIADNFGWFFVHDGKRYGNWIDTTEHKIKDTQKTWEVLKKNALQTKQEII